MVDFSPLLIAQHLALAARWTIVLSLVAFVGGALVGLALLFSRLYNENIDRWIVKPFVNIFQGTPLLMQLFLVFFGLALLGINLPAWVAAALALTLFSAAFLTEIWHGCVLSVPKGQWEASESLALNFEQQMRYVVLPQALRMAIPPTVGFMVQVIKGTALASVIGFIELTKTGQMIANASFKPFTVFALVALAYFVLCFPLSSYSRYLERKLAPHA